MARAGLAPRVETAIEIGPTRAIAGMMKLQSGGTSTTLTSIVRASALPEHAHVELRVGGGGEDQERALEVVAAVLAEVEPQRSLAPEPLDLGQCVQRHDVHVRLGREQTLDLLQAHRPRAHHEAARARAGFGTS